MSKSSLSRSDRINNLKNNIAEIRKYFKVNIDNITIDDLNKLEELKKESDIAIRIAQRFAQNLENFSKDNTEAFEEKLKDQPSVIVKSVKRIFQSTIISSTSRVSNNIFKFIKEKRDLIYEGFLTSNVTEIIEGILEYRKQIDKIHPELSNIIINASGSAITSLIGMYSPSAELFIKSTGIMEKVKNYLSCQNLEKAVELLHVKREELSKDKQLKEFTLNCEKVTQLAKVINVSFEEINNLNLSSSQVQFSLDKIANNPSSREFMQTLCEVAKNLPVNNESLTNILNNLKENIYEELTKNQFPPITHKELSSKLNEIFIKVEKNLQLTTNSNLPIFNRITLQREGTALLLDSMNSYTKEFSKIPNSKAIEINFSKKIGTLINQSLNCPLEKLLLHAQKAPLIAKEIGLDLKFELAVKKTLIKSTSI